jgi:hypothetical protein
MDTMGDSTVMYISVSDQYCSRNTSAGTYSQMKSNLTQGTTAGQLLTQESDAYLIQQDVDPDTAHTLTATQTVNISSTTNTRMSIVEWLLQNFELAPNMSLPRSTVYKLYLRYCNENKLKPLTAASLGKVVTSVFVCLETRRLGKRGKSKYHYYGIRVIPGSEASQLAEDENLVVCQQPSQGHCKFLSCSDVSGLAFWKQKTKMSKMQTIQLPGITPIHYKRILINTCT